MPLYQKPPLRRRLAGAALWLLVPLALSPSIVIAEDIVNPPAPEAVPVEPVNQIPLVQVASAEGVIRSIDIRGAQRLEQETVLSYLQLAPGEEIDQDKISGSLKSLYATGLFKDVAMHMDGGTLVTDVEENPVINKVIFEGNYEVSAEDLEKEIQLKPRLVYTLPRVQRDMKRILDVYRSTGRFAATVEPKLVKLEQNRVDLIFEITEGDRTGVHSIAFVGNKEFSSGDLSEIISTRETAWWRFFSNSDFYDPDRLNFDRELLRKFYLNEGYVDFRVVSANAELTPDKKNFFITFTVEEGERYRIGKVILKSQLKGFDAEELRGDVTVQEGEWYSAAEVEKTINKLTAVMGDRQYAFVDIVPDIDRQRDSKTINLTFSIKEGPRVFVQRIETNGNLRTMDKVIRREILLAEGDPFNMSKLRRSEQRIKDLTFFEDVKVTPEDGAQPDQTVIKVDVKEKATGELSLGAGFSTTDGVLGDFSIRERNFMGKGQDVRIGTTLSSRTKQFDFSFTEPYFLDRDLAAGFDAFRTTRDNQDESAYDETNTGFSLRLGYPLSEQLRQRLSYTFQNTEISDVPSTASRFVKEQSGTTNTSMVGQELIYDTRDSRISPTDGYMMKLTTDFAGLGGSVKYIRTRLLGTTYYPVADDWIVSALAEGGYIWGLDQNVRISDRFFLGGETLRGFRFAGVGPRDLTGGADDALGGERYVRGNVELTMPSPLPDEVGVKFHLFADAGTLGKVAATPLPGEIFRNEESVRISAGMGMTWQSPFGPIRMDFAKALRKESYDKTEVFRFSFGTRF
ncbi:MAG: outer membrane protein assembly factor BamA [Alphaproteobacteria bacterium]|nr:outer membrane protein assembly factor BamA [Alphaproteobacteria bacterium]